MVLFCCILNCGSRGQRDPVRFFRIPAELHFKHRTDLNALSHRRRKKWFDAINREDLNEQNAKYAVVCSKHFISGKAAVLTDEQNPDWVPSLNLADVQRYSRPCPRVELPSQQNEKPRTKAFEPVYKIHQIWLQEEGKLDLNQEDLQGDFWEPETGVATQTDFPKSSDNIELEQSFRKIEELQKKIERFPLGLMDDQLNHTKWEYYTGFRFSVIANIFSEVKTLIHAVSDKNLSDFNQMLLVFVKLRLNLDIQDLAYRFDVKPVMTFTYFHNIIDILYDRFKSLITWPDRSEYSKNTSHIFKQVFRGGKTIVIIDCLEIMTQKPPSFMTETDCWSKQRQHCTVKFLIGILPDGRICYISGSWGGARTDREILELSDFCDFVKPSDIVLAKQSFLNKDAICVFFSNILPFLKQQNQLYPLDLEESVHTFKMEALTEKIIESIKISYKILQDRVPIRMLGETTNPGEPDDLDKIVIVCCALINLSPSSIFSSPPQTN